MELRSLGYLLPCSIIPRVALIAAWIALSDLKSHLVQPFPILLVCFLIMTISSAWAFLVRPPSDCSQELGRNVLRTKKNYSKVLGALGSLIVSFLALIACVMALPYNFLESHGFSPHAIVELVLLPICGFLSYLSLLWVLRRYKKAKRFLGNDYLFRHLMIGKYPEKDYESLLQFGGLFKLYAAHTLSWALLTAFDFVVLIMIILVEFPDRVLFVKRSIICLVCLSATAALLPIYHFSSFITKRIPRAIFPKKRRIPKTRKLLQFPVGVVGVILANNYLIKEKSLNLLWLLVSLDVFWLGNIAMRQPSFEIGMFGLLTGSVLEVAIAIFENGIYTWLVGIGCIILYILHAKLESIKLKFPQYPKLFEAIHLEEMEYMEVEAEEEEEEGYF